MGPASYSSASDSSSGSPSVPFSLPPIHRPDSPTDNTILHNLSDSYYAMRPPHHQHNLYNTNHLASAQQSQLEYVQDPPHLQSNMNGKMNNFAPSSFNNRPSAAFSGFSSAITPTTRPRNLTNSNVLSNTAGLNASNSFYPSHEGFPPRITSPTHISAVNFNGRESFDFGTSPPTKSSAFNTLSDYTSANKPFAHGPPPPQHPSMNQQSFGNGTTSNFAASVQMSSQTPYGPHVPSAANTATNGMVSSIATNGVAQAAPRDSTQEEISTIFVVGFPEDMQEREFQNMFTFSQGFEAATLKIPNKEYTAYGGAVRPNGVSGMPVNYPAGYGGPSDPYGAEGGGGGVPNWPNGISANPGNDDLFNTGGAGANNAPPRKQIIGFAKFRSRTEALEARDVLQGRRVDIEKGAVLKAEMAKKNLHTKRGVGPVAGMGAASDNPGAPPANMGNPQMNGQSGAEVIMARERELGALGAIGLNNNGIGANPAQWRDRMQSIDNGNLMREDEERRQREATAAAMQGAIGLGPAQRGARVRAEELDQRRKDKEMRMRSASTYDAFHSVPVSRQTSNLNGGLVSPSIAQNQQMLINPLDHSSFGTLLSTLSPQQQVQQEEIGPWDEVLRQQPTQTNGNSLVSPTAVARPRSSTHRSTSPVKANNPLSPTMHAAPYQPHQPQRSEVSLQQQSYSSASSAQGHGDDDAQLSKATDNLALNSTDGTTSPQLPSPSSGASSGGSARNTIDQNPPINTLYVGNLPTTPSPPGYPSDHLEETLRELFAKQPGYRRLCFRLKNNGPMCFVEFEDVPHATKALNDLYGNTLNGLIKGGGIRLSYSKNPLGVRTPTGATGQSVQQLGQANNSQQGGAGSFAPESFSSLAPRLQQQQQNGQNAMNRSNATTFTSDVFPSRLQQLDIDSARQSNLIQRRDHGVISPPGHQQPFNNFMLSSPPPPRFQPLSTSSAPFGGVGLSSSSAAFSNGAGNASHLGLGGQNFTSTVSGGSFAPFAKAPGPSQSMPYDQQQQQGGRVRDSMEYSDVDQQYVSMTSPTQQYPNSQFSSSVKT